MSNKTKSFRLLLLNDLSSPWLVRYNISCNISMRNLRELSSGKWPFLEKHPFYAPFPWSCVSIVFGWVWEVSLKLPRPWKKGIKWFVFRRITWIRFWGFYPRFTRSNTFKTRPRQSKSEISLLINVTRLFIRLTTPLQIYPVKSPKMSAFNTPVVSAIDGFFRNCCRWFFYRRKMFHFP